MRNIKEIVNTMKDIFNAKANEVRAEFGVEEMENARYQKKMAIGTQEHGPGYRPYKDFAYQQAGMEEQQPVPQKQAPTPKVIPQAQNTANKYTDIVSKYFPKEEINNAINVMFKESSGNPGAINVNNNGSKDYGWFQINDIHAPRIKQTFGYSMEDMLDPEKNLEVASWLFQQQGWNPWVAARGLGLVK